MPIEKLNQTTGRAHRPLAEINVTPFVDVMLVLLVIFMITAPLMQQGVNVDLPDATTTPLRLQDEPLVLSVKPDGSIFIARQEVPLAELEAKLEALLLARGDEAIYLRADRDAPYHAVARALAAAQNAGADRLGLVTDPE